jgi:protein-arginine kinase
MSAEDQKFIVSTRVRVSRNLADYPLGPGITDKQRLEIMYKMSSAFEEMFKG